MTRPALPRLGDLLSRLSTAGTYFWVFLLLLFPLLSAFQEVAVLLTQDPTLLPFLGFVDAGGQGIVSRSLLRILLSVLCLFALLVPQRVCEDYGVWSFPWPAFFLLGGLVSVGVSSRPAYSEGEWETWALLLLTASVLKRSGLKSLWQATTIGLYTVVAGVFLHALWVSVPASSARLGGVFHHANALSTLLVMLFPFLFFHAGKGGKEGHWAALLAGSTLGLQLWTGSLTGYCIVLGMGTAWLLRENSFALRCAMSTLALFLPAMFNFAGGWLASIGYVIVLLALIGLCLWRSRNYPSSLSIAFLLSLTLSVAAFTALQSDELTSAGVQSRDRSVGARVHFYEASLKLTSEAPVWGHGPASFGREYPRFQGSVLYFSRFVHSLPLEIVSEWGLCGAFFGALALAQAWRMNSSPVFRWSFVGFALHCLTGVQSQFPYLFALQVVLWAATAEATDQVQGNRFVDATTRVLISAALLLLIPLNGTRTVAAVNESMAFRVLQARGYEQSKVVDEMLSVSIASLPTEGQFLLNYARFKQKLDQDFEAELLAGRAIDTDENWAAPKQVLLSLSKEPLEAFLIEQAIEVDPINYPMFYQVKAESLLRRGDANEALRLLREASDHLTPTLLAQLPSFRADDLEEQLVTLWLLRAIIEERSGDHRAAERAFRRALLFARQRLVRYRLLVEYPTERQFATGPMLEQLLLQVRQQIPAE